MHPHDERMSPTRRELMLAAAALGAAAAASAQAPGSAIGGTGAATPSHLALKVNIIGRRKPGTTLAEHRHHIRRVHGELVLRNIAVDSRSAPQRYVQNAVFDGTFRPDAKAGDPFALTRDFVTQVWFPDLAALMAARQSPFYMQHLKADEDNFVDQSSVVFVPCREREAFRREGARARADAVKLFCLLQARPGADAAMFAKAWASAADALKQMPAAGAVIRHVRNEPLPAPPTAPAPRPIDAIDEVWVDDEASGRALLSQWREWLRGALEEPGLIARDSAVLLLAREDVLHAGTS